MLRFVKLGRRLAVVAVGMKIGLVFMVVVVMVQIRQKGPGISIPVCVLPPCLGYSVSVVPNSFLCALPRIATWLVLILTLRCRLT